MISDQRTIILFDGYCNLCSKSVQFIKKRDRKKIFSFIPLQSMEALEIKDLPVYDKKFPVSIILVEKGKIYQLSAAALRIAYRLNFPWNLFIGFIIIPPFIRNGIYMFISKNRYKWFGKKETCFIA